MKKSSEEDFGVFSFSAAGQKRKLRDMMWTRQTMRKVEYRRERREIESTMVRNKKNVLFLSIISVIVVSIILVYFNNKNEKRTEISPQNHDVIMFTDNNYSKSVEFTKEMRKELDELFIANNIQELERGQWLKLEPTEFIQISSGGITQLVIYAENHNTYIERYENGRIDRRYIIDNDITEKIKNLVHITDK